MAQVKVKSADQDKNKRPTSTVSQKIGSQQRDELGQFSTGSGGLASIKRLKWARIVPVVVVVALVGGFLVYRGFASGALLAAPGSKTGEKDCFDANGTVVKETSGSKRNASVCQLAASRTLTPVIFGDNRARSTNANQFHSLVGDRMRETGYYEVCYNIRRASSAQATVSFGGYIGSNTQGPGTTQTITNSDYETVCDPGSYQAGNTRPFLRVQSGTVRISSIGLTVASAPSQPPLQPQSGVTPGSSFYWNLENTNAASYNTFFSGSNPNKILDFDPGLDRNSQSSFIQTARNRGATKIICYFSAGTWESWRADASRLQPYRGALLPQWGEYYLNIKEQAVRAVMAERIQRAKTMGCDGIEPDNLDAYSNDRTFNLTEADQLNYLKFLADEAHKHDLLIGLKNVPELVTKSVGGQAIVDIYDFALNEECYTYNECGNYTRFIDKNKAVFIVEYERNPNCTDSSNKKYMSYRANTNYSLNGQTWVPCSGQGG